MKLKHTFRKTIHVTVHNTKITHYHSEVSGLQIIIFDTDTNVTHMDCCIRTEPDSDDGKPHALEHSIFNGSKTIPYHNSLKNIILNSLNVSYNAFTSLDCTTYHLSNLYSSFLDIFPIYLDHIFFPSLSVDSFNTEVYNVTAKGDGGVIYNEMYKFKNDIQRTIRSNVMKTLYNKTNYAKVSGGKSNEIRTLTINKLRNYHAKYYRPDNCMIYIKGNVNHTEILDRLCNIEKQFQIKKSEMKHTKTINTRPWMNPIPSMKIQKKTVEYPDCKETHGFVHLLWRKCNWNDFYSFHAITVILEYICKDKLITLSMVDNKDQWATSISYRGYFYKKVSFHIHFSTVPLTKLDKIEIKFMRLLKQCIKSLKLKDIQNIIKYRILHCYKNIEKNNIDLSYYKRDFVYSQNIHSWSKIDSVVGRYKKLFAEDIMFWKKLISTFTSHYSVLISKPSLKLLQHSIQEDADRLIEIKNMGKHELDHLRQKLDKSIQNNKRSFEKIMAFVSSNKTNNLNILNKINLKSVNYVFNKNAFMYTIDTKFTTITISYDVSNFTSKELTCLYFLKHTLFQYSSNDLNDKIINYSDLTKFLRKYYMSYYIKDGASFKCFQFTFETCHSNIEHKIKLFEHMIQNPQVTVKRTNMIINKYNNHYDRIKKNGEILLRWIHHHNLKNGQVNMLDVYQFLNKNDTTNIIKSIEKVKTKLFKQKVFYKIITKNAGKQILGALTLSKKPFVFSNHTFLAKIRIRNTCLLVTNSKSDTLLASTPCFIELTDDDITRMVILCYYLSKSRGGLHDTLRDSGLAYDCSMRLNIGDNLLTVMICRSSDVSTAYKKIIRGLTSVKHMGFDDDILTNCKTMLLTNFVHNNDNDLLRVNTFHTMYERSRNANCIEHYKTILTNTTVDDLSRMFNKYVTNLINPNTSFLSVVTNQYNKENVSNMFKQFDRSVTYVDADHLNINHVTG